MPKIILNKLPLAAQAFWDSTYKIANKTYDNTKAERIAWVATKNRMQEVKGVMVARSKDFLKFNTVSYEFIADETSVSRTIDGSVNVSYILGTTKQIDGIKFSQVALKRMAEQINSEGVVGRIDSDFKHKLLKDLQAKGLTPEQVEIELQKLITGIKAVGAKVENNNLVANVSFSKSAYEQAKGFKAVSLEARYPESSVKLGTTDQARLTGFVLTDSPADADAVKL